MMKRGVYSRKREEWEERLLRFGKSGLTVAEFCEWEGVSPASYYNWRKRLGREQAPNRDASGVAPFSPAAISAA